MTYDQINNYDSLLDFKKAFDSISYTLLIHKLRHYDIRGTANKLLCSFLSDRY